MCVCVRVCECVFVCVWGKVGSVGLHVREEGWFSGGGVGSGGEWRGKGTKRAKGQTLGGGGVRGKGQMLVNGKLN